MFINIHNNSHCEIYYRWKSLRQRTIINLAANPISIVFKQIPMNNSGQSLILVNSYMLDEKCEFRGILLLVSPGTASQIFIVSLRPSHQFNIKPVIMPIYQYMPSVINLHKIDLESLVIDTPMHIHRRKSRSRYSFWIRPYTHKFYRFRSST